MGGLCQQAWEGEEDRDEGGVFIEWGVWDEQNCWLCNCYVWVFNEPLSSCSLATELLLLAREVQHKHTHKCTHIKTYFAVQKLLKLSPIKEHTQHIHFSNETPNVRALFKPCVAKFFSFMYVEVSLLHCVCVCVYLLVYSMSQFKISLC